MSFFLVILEQQNRKFSNMLRKQPIELSLPQAKAQVLLVSRQVSDGIL
jgi:hypothetical protein